jgi:hypothetical protein
MRPSDAVKEVCESLLSGDRKRAEEIARTYYPFKPTTYKEISADLLTEKIWQAKKAARMNPTNKPGTLAKRKWGSLSYTKVFIRDGFIDRYSGQRLVFPAAIKLLSLLMPNEFPEHPNWALKHGHVIYWELLPTIDHVVPIARGGEDVDSNWVSTSWLYNFIKLDFTLEELGWSLHPAGSFEEWDGLLGWFIKYVEEHPQYLSHKILKSWHVAANCCLAELSS